MNDRASGSRGTAGFTMIEVLIAMVLLGVGLLGLQGLSIRAAQMGAFADRQSEFTLVATSYLEAAADSAYFNSLTEDCRTTFFDTGDPRIVTVRRVVAGGNQWRSIEVTVVPAEFGGQQPPQVTVSTRVFQTSIAPCP